MNRKLNEKGFTLVEVLAVLVILVAIMGIAIPSISSSLERTKEKQNKARYKIIESAAEQYVTDHKNQVYNKLSSNKCYLLVSDLSDYLSEDEMVDADEASLKNWKITVTWPNKFKLDKTSTASKSCK